MQEYPVHADLCNRIFFQCIHDYHVDDSINSEMRNPFDQTNEYLEYLLYCKCWIDTVQWHLEDVIRDPGIDPKEALGIKRRIDQSNQGRNDTVEKIDEWIIGVFNKINVAKQNNAKMNSESPAWIIDRLSIICLKIYHMKLEIERIDAGDEHRDICAKKFDLLNQQLADLTTCFNELMEGINKGEKYMKVYRQMKMYNDPAMNPVLYARSQKS